jgi:hypothetical protein
VQPDWVWVPDHYVWAPRGYVFVDGYWDYSIGRRGVLFAPVYFNRGIYSQPGFSYSPATVIDLGVFASHLFLRPQYGHYYFGDYYAANYQTAGFYPWFSFQSSRYGYDPLYAHQRWENRQDPQWANRVAADFQLRRQQEDSRPPRTLAAQKALGAAGVSLPGRGLVVATPLDQLTKSKDSRLRFLPVDAAERQKLGHYGQEVQKTREERQRLETTAAGVSAKKPPAEFVPARVTLPRSPIVARPAAELAKDHVPPKTYAAPKPDLKVEPRARSESRGKASGESKGKSKT